MAYNGTTDLISGIRQKNGGNFPLVDASAVRVTDSQRLDAKLTALDGQVSALNAAETATAGNMAPEFSSSTAYKAGNYVLYQGTLYRFTADHAAGAWVETDATVEKIAPVVSDLKESLEKYTKVTKNLIDPQNLDVKNYYVQSTGNVVENSAYRLLIFPCETVSGDYVIFTAFGDLSNYTTINSLTIFSDYPAIGVTGTRISAGVSPTNHTINSPVGSGSYIAINIGGGGDLDDIIDTIKSNGLLYIDNQAVDFNNVEYIMHRIIAVQESNLSADILEKLNNNAQTVKYIENKSIHVGSNELGNVTLGTGWTESDGIYTHASGNTDSLEFQTNLTVGDIAILDFDTSYSANEFITVGIGTAYRILCYNGTTHIRVPLKAIGNTTLYLTPLSTFSGSISNLTLRKIQETGTEIELAYSNTLTDNHEDTYGFWNTLLGDLTAENAVGTSRSIAIGFSALRDLQGGHRNIGIGTFAMSQLIGGERNVAIGADAMLEIQKGEHNIAVGDGALYHGANASYNIAIGASALASTAGSNPATNVAIGGNSGAHTSGMDNVFVGHNSGYRNTNGSKNVIIGVSRGPTGGSNNTLVGADIESNSSLTDSIGIGKGAVPTKNNQIMLGSTAITEVVVCGNKKIIFNNDGTVTWEAVT